MEFAVALERVIAAPRSRVYRAWLDPAVLARWMGPDGHSVVFATVDERVGGAHVVELIGPDGAHHSFTSVIEELVPDERIVMEHGAEDSDDPNRFRVTVTFDEQSDGKTVLTMRQLHPTPERRRFVIGFGAVEYGLQTLDGLAAWLDR